MDQKLFLQKLTEVADWEWERIPGAGSSGKNPEELYADYPEQIKLNRFKNRICPYQEDKEDCYWKIYSKGYSTDPKVLVQKCETCGALRTPKGRYIAKPDGYNYPKIIVEADRD